MFSKPILDYTAEDLKANLRAFIARGLELSVEVSKLAKKLEDFGTDLRHSGGALVVDGALSKWIDSVEKQATREHQGDVSVKIELRYANVRYPLNVPDDRDRDFSAITDRRDYRFEMCQAGDTNVSGLMSIVDDFLAFVDFEGLQAEIENQAKVLVKAGYQEAANKVAEFLGLSGYTPQDTEFTPKGLVFFSVYGGSCEGMNRYEMIEGLSEAATHLRLAEKDVGIAGVSAAVSQIRSMFATSGYNDVIPSRTEAGISGVLSAEIFKGKTRFTLESSRADALLSFIAQYGTVEIPNLKAAA